MEITWRVGAANDHTLQNMKLGRSQLAVRGVGW
jgi:hypothetical protein